MMMILGAAILTSAIGVSGPNLSESAQGHIGNGAVARDGHGSETGRDAENGSKISEIDKGSKVTEIDKGSRDAENGSKVTDAGAHGPSSI